MRPYFAIIVDSFREALASRVLWILLILITLVLVGIAPLGYRSEVTTQFRNNDIKSPQELVERIREQFATGDPSPGKRIWSLWDEELRKQLAEFQELEAKRGLAYVDGLEILTEGLNELLPRRDLYREEDWQDEFPGNEAKEMLERGIDDLADGEVARLNRLLIESPFARLFRERPPEQIVLTYFSFAISPPIPFPKARINRFVEELVLPGLIKALVGVLAIMVAIVVTSPIVPQMFESGSLSLLLSKPTSRSLLFLAKFVGGCAFIIINVAYLLIGLWLIVGLRLGIWNQGLLLCIPIFMFLFAIYYSVSAFAGAVWRNPVISVVMAFLLWLLCFCVGATKGLFEEFGVEPRRIVRLVPVNDELLSLNDRNLARWNAESSDWTAIYQTNGPMYRVIGPVYDEANKQLLSAQVFKGSFFPGQTQLMIGTPERDWQMNEGPSLPKGVFELLEEPGGALVVTNERLYRLSGELDKNRNEIELLWMKIPTDLGRGPFQAVGPRTSLDIEMPAVATINPDSGEVAIFSRGRLIVLATDDKGHFMVRRETELEGDKDMGAAIAFGGDTILLARTEGPILEIAADNLKVRQEYYAEPASQPRFVRAAPGGRWFAVVFQNFRLYLLDTQDSGGARLRRAPVASQGDISAVTFPDAQRMVVAHHIARVSEYPLASFERRQKFVPPMTPLEIAYRYAILPIYTVFPKPSELDNTVFYVLTEQETVDLTIMAGDIEARRPKVPPWAPVISSAAFTVVVLLLACWYVERQEF